MNQDPMVICPSASELSKEVCRNVMCTVAGCQKVLPHVSALRFHRIKVHCLIEVSEQAVDINYAFND